jgi:LysR family glycine cleavage system transcriptional activator
MHIPPMQALRAFEAAARAQSLSRAAEALSVTHGAVSHQIKALEASLGVRLIERAGRGIRVTEEGARLASRLRVALAEIADAVREASQRSNPRQLRVSVMPSFAARWLLPRLGSFLAKHRDIDLDVRSNMALVDFRRDDADVAIRYGLGKWPDVEAELLMGDTFFPVCSPRLAAKLPAHPADRRARRRAGPGESCARGARDHAGAGDAVAVRLGPVNGEDRPLASARPC